MKRYNFFYYGQPIPSANFLKQVPEKWEDEVKDRQYAYGGYRAFQNGGNYEVCCRENGDIIEDGLNKDEAIELIERYEAMDRREGSYSPDFYQARRSR